jgi:UDP-hydrolysing UDP-N-acetyl-D-glucosamine 2-epimerase
MRRIGVVTVARSDYGVCRPLLRAIEAADDLELVLIAGGMHLDPALGDTIGEILADGFAPAARVPCSPEDDTPAGLARAMGRGTAGFAAAYEELGLDLLVVLGDRFEMHAAALAAQPFLIPVAHIDGGALTTGAIDDALRHSMTKLASLHFVENEPYRDRVVQMGELPERVYITGALGLDNLTEIELLPPDELDRRFGLALEEFGPPLLVTFHPVTRDYANTRRDAEALLAALDEIGLPLVFTYPNADTQGRVIVELIEAFAAERPRVRCVPHLGTQGYFSLMARAAAMAGNSSSGIIEAASFRLPVVDIGSRQHGRLAPDNVIHSGPGKAEIREGLRKALDPVFRKLLENLENPYGDGRAAPRMVEVLRQVDLADPTLIQKPFHDLPQG